MLTTRVLSVLLDSFIIVIWVMLIVWLSAAMIIIIISMILVVNRSPHVVVVVQVLFMGVPGVSCSMTGAGVMESTSIRYIPMILCVNITGIVAGGLVSIYFFPRSVGKMDISTVRVVRNTMLYRIPA